MCRFVESLRVEQRKLMHIEWHERRMRQTLLYHYGYEPEVNLRASVALPEELDNGVYKCRIVYDSLIEDVSFAAYEPKKVDTLRLVMDDAMDYPFKYEDRSSLDRILMRRDGADDVLIVKNGCLTDTSFSNIALFREGLWYTPDTFLLNGTCRQRLLADGLIREARITVDDLGKYAEIRLINAMLDWKRRPSVSILPFV